MFERKKLPLNIVGTEVPK
ncbi:hypothetical protein Zm00014a_002145 [Zea mays]|uniref:Uncharacterized protein n=1 Tax=Zea mays TaxID=4577 RepID=A0A3L6F605_MAIZE|nr:hypothetical protein Zm00014a_002145 [Zea mays]